jgi:hypothetical protein
VYADYYSLTYCVRDQTGFEIVGRNLIMRRCFESGADIFRKEVFNAKEADICANSTVRATKQ